MLTAFLEATKRVEAEAEILTANAACQKSNLIRLLEEQVHRHADLARAAAQAHQRELTQLRVGVA